MRVMTGSHPYYPHATTDEGRRCLFGNAIVGNQDIYVRNRADDCGADHANLAGICNHDHLSCLANHGAKGQSAHCRGRYERSIKKKTARRSPGNHDKGRRMEDTVSSMSGPCDHFGRIVRKAQLAHEIIGGRVDFEGSQKLITSRNLHFDTFFRGEKEEIAN